MSYTVRPTRALYCLRATEGFEKHKYYDYDEVREDDNGRHSFKAVFREYMEERDYTLAALACNLSQHIDGDAWCVVCIALFDDTDGRRHCLEAGVTAESKDTLAPLFCQAREVK